MIWELPEPAAVEVKTEIVAPVPIEIKVENYMPISDPKNVRKFVEDYFVDIPILVKIAGCESHFRHMNFKGRVIRGEQNEFDIGVMQINALYHEDIAVKMGLNIYNIEDNVKYARYLYEKQGVKPWVSSGACWSKPLKSEIARR